MPPLLQLKDRNAYRQHYVEILCRGCIRTYDGIRVYFKPSTFDHAFFESSDKRGSKDSFSQVRAERMDWIANTLANPNSPCLQGWVRRKGVHDPTRRVTVGLQDFAIVVGLRDGRDSKLKANFITCYVADQSAHLIRKSPKWTREAYDTASKEKSER